MFILPVKSLNQLTLERFKSVLTTVLAFAMAIASVPASFATYEADQTVGDPDYDPNKQLPLTYQDSDTYKSNSAAFEKAVEELLFTSGYIGSAESTGKIGLAPNAPKPTATTDTTVGYLRNYVTDSITWTLSDGVLIFTGTGTSILPFMVNDKPVDLGLFSKNYNIKTVVIGSGITNMNLDLREARNIKTVIYIDNSTMHDVFNDCNVIYGVNANKTVDMRYNKNKGKDYTIYKEKDKAIAAIKEILADATLNDTARAMIPEECGGTGPNPVAEAKPADPADKTVVADWAKADIETLWSMGIATGDKGADLTKPITRWKFAYTAVKIYRKVTGKEPDTTVNHKFTDVNPNSTYINQAHNLGIISGISETQFNPNGTLTREQAATMLARLAEACGKPLASTSENPFTDTISTWAKDGVLSCKASNIMNGVSDTTFDAKATYSIQQALVTMLRLYNYVKQ